MTTLDMKTDLGQMLFKAGRLVMKALSQGNPYLADGVKIFDKMPRGARDQLMEGALQMCKDMHDTMLNFDYASKITGKILPKDWPLYASGVVGNTVMMLMTLEQVGEITQTDEERVTKGASLYMFKNLVHSLSAAQVIASIMNDIAIRIEDEAPGVTESDDAFWKYVVENFVPTMEEEIEGFPGEINVD